MPLNCSAVEHSWESLGLSREIKAVNPKGTNSEDSLEGLMLKLKLQYLVATCYEELTHWKRLMLGKIEGKRRRGQQRMKWLNSTINSIDINLNKLWEIVKDRGAWLLQSNGLQSQTWFSDWTKTTTTNDAWYEKCRRSLSVRIHQVCVQSGLTLSNSMDCNMPDSSVQGIFQARILEWVVISFSRGSSQPRSQTCVSCSFCIGRQILYHCASWKFLHQA